jgi:hypothetical protein
MRCSKIILLAMVVAAGCSGGDSKSDVQVSADVVPLDDLEAVDVVTDLAGETVGDLTGEAEIETPADVSADSGPELQCDPLPTLALRTLEEAAAEGALSPGEVVTASLDGTVTLPAQNGGEEFLLILYDLGTSRNVTHEYVITSDIEPEEEEQPIGFPQVIPMGLPHLPQGLAWPGKLAAPMPQPLPERGEIVTFSIPFGYIVQEVEAEVMLVTDRLVVYNDLTTPNPLDDVKVETLEEFAQLFEDVVQPRERFFWGDESDVNGDGRVTMLFSHLVNQSGAYAFVTSCDLQDQEVCGFSNEQETIYVAIPDPEEKINSPTAYAELIAHEFNHSIYFYRKFLLNEITGETENIYVTEGMSGLAQDLTGFNRGNQFVAMAGMTEISSVSLPDIHRYEPGAGYDEARDGALRGASYLFLRYLFDQAGGEIMDEAGNFEASCGSQLLHNWINSPMTMPELAAEATGLPYDEVAANWFTALALSNRPAGGALLQVSPVFSYLPVTTDPVTGNQRGFNLWGNIMGFMPLHGPTVQPLAAADGVLREGGVEYFEVTATEPGEISITVDPGSAPAAYLRVVRVDGI